LAEAAAGIPHLVTENDFELLENAVRREKKETAGLQTTSTLLQRPRHGTFETPSCKGDKKQDFSLSYCGTG